MNIEQTGLLGRAARHAALAEPLRLRLVDLLTLGDYSPKELQRELGLSSSLLAHHLNVLEGVGMIARTRSEADRRRSYVRLAPEALEDMGPSAAAAAQRVVFVCTANSARSQLAAALWNRRSSIPVTSAGTHPAEKVASGAVAAAGRHGLDLPDVTPRLVDDVVRPDDYVVTVCDSAHEELGEIGLLHWSIPDPVALGTARAFDAAFDQLSLRVDALASRLTPA
jgi:protein-tyrosine-phosphatase